MSAEAGIKGSRDQGRKKYRTAMPVLRRYASGVRDEVAQGPVIADTIAIRVCLHCYHDNDPRESRRRIIRDVISYLRDQGERICANHTEGYWLARSQREWDAYKDAVHKRAVFKFAERKQWVQAATDKLSGQGQLPLGEPMPAYCR